MKRKERGGGNALVEGGGNALVEGGQRKDGEGNAGEEGEMGEEKKRQVAYMFSSARIRVRQLDQRIRRPLLLQLLALLVPLGLGPHALGLLQPESARCVYTYIYK